MRVYATENLTQRGDAYALLACGAKEFRCFDALPAIDRAPGGKPFFPEHPDCHFNLSHSGNLALCALSGTPVGVDIQIVKYNWREGLPRRVCAPRELEWLEKQPRRWDAFTLLWALKEARVKYDGTGLAAGVREISVPLPKEEQSLYRHDGLWFRTYKGDGWMAAACGEDIPPENLIWV